MEVLKGNHPGISTWILYVFYWMCCFPRLVEEFDMVAGFIEYCLISDKPIYFPWILPKFDKHGGFSPIIWTTNDHNSTKKRFDSAQASNGTLALGG